MGNDAHELTVEIKKNRSSITGNNHIDQKAEIQLRQKAKVIPTAVKSMNAQ